MFISNWTDTRRVAERHLTGFTRFIITRSTQTSICISNELVNHVRDDSQVDVLLIVSYLRWINEDLSHHMHTVPTRHSQSSTTSYSNEFHRSVMLAIGSSFEASKEELLTDEAATAFLQGGDAG